MIYIYIYIQPQGFQAFLFILFSVSLHINFTFLYLFLLYPQVAHRLQDSFTIIQPAYVQALMPPSSSPTIT